MTPSLDTVERAEADQWDRIWSRCDSSTYFHGPEWFEVWHRSTNGKVHPDARIARFSDGSTAVLPLSASRLFRGLATQYRSSPAGTYGGWISADALTGAHLEQLHSWTLRSLPDLHWRINPFGPAIRLPETASLIDDRTHALDLAGGFEAIERLWARQGNAIRRKVRQALRHGVTIRRASSEADWRRYDQLYRETLARWGTQASSRYDWSLFEAMHALRSERIALWLAESQDELVAGALCLASRSHVAYWHGAASREFMHQRPANLLMHEAIRDACARGCRWFDFNPSGGHRGAALFKRSFGAQALDCPIVHSETGRYRLVRRLGSLTHRSAA